MSEAYANFSAASTAGSNVKILVFTDSGGEPDALVATTGAIAVPAGGGWVSAPISGALSTGTYWIGMVCDSFQSRFTYVGPSGRSKMADGTYDYATTPGTWPGTTAPYNIIFSTYVLYT